MAAVAGSSSAHLLRGRLFDTHCHLGLFDHPTLSLQNLHERALSRNVQRMIVVGLDAEMSRKAKAVSDTLGDETVLWSAGIHPNSAHRHESDMDDIAKMAREHSSCVAIGETGLDLFRKTCDIDVQKISLRKHIALALEVSKPVIFHCRDAYDELLEVLQDVPEAAAGRLRGVMHCFSSHATHADAFCKLGLHISFAGPVTYPKSRDLRDACTAVPGDRLLIETDAPFLPPQSCRGTNNEPALVAEVCETVARCRGIAVEDVAELTFINACRLFGVALPQ